MASENWFLSLVCNLVLPITLLNKGTVYLGPKVAVLLALAFPLGYGIYFLLKNKKVNPVSVLGLLNVLVTGSLALSGLTGFWFALKEGAFPALIGLFVLGSSWTRRPFMGFLLLNPQVMELEKLETKLKEDAIEGQFQQLLRLGTRLLSLSFFFSASINFTLGLHIFSEIDPGLDATQRSVILNSQLAKMTGWSMVAIVLPSMILMMGLMFFLLRRLEKMTGESWQNFVKS